MSAAVDGPSLQRFRSLVAERLGLEFPDEKLDELADVMRLRVRATGSGAGDAYLRRLVAGPAAQLEMREVAGHLTVGETYFFRNPNHFRAFVEVVLPARLAAPGRTRGLQVLCAGCASGEEPYTVAMSLREQQAAGAHLAPPSIVGVDVNAAGLEKARGGRYSPWSLRATPAAVRQRWFRAEGGQLVLDDEIRKMVRFEAANLAQGVDVAPPGSLDVVFCRNVFIYFSSEAMRAAVEGFARLLQPGGYLFLGDAESLRGLSTAFELRHTHDTFYYRLRGAGEETRPMPASDGGGWQQAIEGATRRVASLRQSTGMAAPAAATPATAAARTPANAAPGAAPRPAWDLGAIRQLVDADREVEALAAIAGLPDAARADPEVLLLSAALLTSRGDLAAAERTCRELLAVDEFNAGAHYLLAVASEQRGALGDAREHDRIAAYLDPEFAMPHLHLGRLARRAGDLPRARDELTRALELFDGAEVGRLRLFTGGFSREALRELCRGELAACEVAR